MDDNDASIRHDVGTAVGFVLGTVLLTAKAGRLTSPAELQALLNHYQTTFASFTPGVEAVVRGVVEGLGAANLEDNPDR